MEMTQSKTDQVIKAAIGVLLVALAGVIVYTMQDHIVVAGDSAPNFNLTTDNGKQITPTNFGGKVLVLNFWASWCPPCVQEMPSLNEFQKMFAADGVVVLGTHVPAVYGLALRNDTAHQAEHALYLFSALLMWAPLLGVDPLPRRRVRIGRGLLLLTVLRHGLAG